ncbi:hypothetical protein QQF64_021597 [Cirrhinus molitorella]|uniref:Uncharacterized protein n=1 Tax=Cirrhinus molitorella TaxID=172907 RepID=A0ABR3L9B9_9TELE
MRVYLSLSNTHKAFWETSFRNPHPEQELRLLTNVTWCLNADLRRLRGDLFLVIISIEEHEEPCEIKAVDQTSQITHQLIHKRAWIGEKESSWGAKTRLYEGFQEEMNRFGQQKGKLNGQIKEEKTIGTSKGLAVLHK